MTFNGYINDHDMGYNIAMLKITTDLGNQRGWFGTGYNDGFYGDVVFNIYSYPSDKFNCDMYKQTCHYNSFTENEMITYECDFSHKCVGGDPVFQYLSGGGNRIYGVYSGKSSTKNVAARITAGKWSTMCDYMERDTPGHCG